MSGHVDGVGTVAAFAPVETVAGKLASRDRRAGGDCPLHCAERFDRRDGVSLTSNAVDGTRFTVNLIPHTLAVTTLGKLAIGAGVNLEVDLIARYVERMRHA